MAADRFTIGQLARQVQLPATTLRYYERIGLLTPDDRSQGNYRLYRKASLERLRFIRSAQSIGFTLDDIRALLGARAGTPPSCAGVQELIKQRLAEIDERLSSLRQVQRLLISSLRKCQRTARSRCCHVLESLERTSAR
jgi:MerR family mercuric resistance operon transcriptional regulator